MTDRIMDYRSKVEYEVVFDQEDWEYFMNSPMEFESKDRPYFIRVDEKEKVIKIVDANGNCLRIIDVIDIKSIE